MSRLPVRPTHAAQAAARWIDSYLLPLVAAEHLIVPGRVLRCLHVEPFDELEAMHLRRLGHDCDVLLSPLPRPQPAARWERPPFVADMASLPLAGHCYDLIWSAAFGRLNHGPERRRASARELLRICAPGGGVLLMQGNAASPLDVSTGLRPSLGRLGTPGPHLTTLDGLQQAFVGDAGFAVMGLHSLAGHFGWGRVPHGLRSVAGALERYLSWASRPDRPARYASAFNPMFALWFGRAPLRE